MTAFDEVFRELAHEEYLTFALDGRRGRRGASYVVRELYCSRPRCDCQSVVLVALEGGARVAAVIHLALGASEPFLDPDGPTGAIADDVLAACADFLDRGYRETLRRHYALWRAAIDDRSHPAHARIRELSGSGPRGPRRPRPKPPAAPRTGVAIAIAKRARGSASKAQQKFSRLVRKVEGLRARVRRWHDERPAIDRGLAVYQAELATQRTLARQFVEALDQALTDPTLAKKHRQKLRSLICTICKDLIEDGHGELRAIYDRHAKRSYDEDAAAGERAEVASLKSMLEVMGMDFEGEDIRSLDDLKAATRREMEKHDQQAEARAAASDRRRASRKKSAKQAAREAAAQVEQRDAGKVLQDVYRKLAVALHPDLERDAAEQARKTQLMQEVNAAYAKKDLLRLLELQLAFERVDEDAQDIAEERLAHYTRILDDQARQLAAELDELELPWRVQLDRPPPAPIAASDVLAALARDTEDLRETIVAQREDLRVVTDPQRLPGWLKTVNVGRRSDSIPF